MPSLQVENFKHETRNITINWLMQAIPAPVSAHRNRNGKKNTSPPARQYSASANYMMRLVNIYASGARARSISWQMVMLVVQAVEDVSVWVAGE